jgi:hypothetical protein
VGTETVKGTIFHVEGNHTNTLTILHDQVKCEIFNEKVGVVSQRLTIQTVENRMASSIGGSCTTVCLTSFAVFERLPTEGTLIDFSFLCTRKGHAVVFKLRKEIFNTVIYVTISKLTSTTV